MAGLACGLLALVTPVTRASYTLPALVSYTGNVEAEDAYSPAISADGRYVAFNGSFNGVSGVYRKDMQTGELALVAGADAAAPALSAPSAGAPSISGDGRYVSFTTTTPLDPADDPGNGCYSVYVRDMEAAIGQPGAYTLASALNGTNEGITYAGTGAGGSCPGGGSAAADRVALSESGREVAFTVLGQSNLTTGVGGATETPPAQVAVRNLETDTTTLVSQTLSSLQSGESEGVPGGAALTTPSDLLFEGDGRVLSGSTAAISADGSTVAWMGIDIPAQAPAASAEAPGAYPDEYDEPLWRRIADGPSAPTRRVTGGDDPECGCAGPLDTTFSPGFAPDSPGPEFGTYVAPAGFPDDPLTNAAGSLDAVTPQLSANGQTVAILSTQPRNAELSKGLEEQSTPSTANAFVVNMANGLTRTTALTQLTQWGSHNFDNTTATGTIGAIAISPDGSEVAFTTARTEFPLSSPTLITPALSQAVPLELYVANLAAGTLALASDGYSGTPADGNVADPSFSDNGTTLAFSSSATSLVYGAYNHGDASGQDGDVFLISQANSPAVPGIQQTTPLPANPSLGPAWEMLATSKPGPHGTVLLYITVPGAGMLTAHARSELRVTVASKSAKGRKSSARVHRRTGVVSRQVASAGARAIGPGLIELRLTSASAYRALVQAHDGLYATITVTFSAHGERTLTSTVQASFHGKRAKAAKKAERR
jgi:Tol biopolymer transport system component